jgi:hypothetical protein
MFDVGAVIGFLIVIALGIIILRYLCVFAYGLFCYNPPNPCDNSITPVDIVTISKNQIIPINVSNYCISDAEFREQHIIPIANIV